MFFLIHHQQNLHLLFFYEIIFYPQNQINQLITFEIHVNIFNIDQDLDFYFLSLFSLSEVLQPLMIKYLI
jgi:hypothetical protein